MKLLKNVLIKLVRSGVVDRVLYIDNIPEELFYSPQHPKIITDRGTKGSQYWTVDVTQPKVMTLYEKLNKSQTGDDGIVFDMQNIHAKDLWSAVDAYIKANYPGNKLPPAPAPYSTDPTDARSPALALSQVPRAVLSVLSPSGKTDAGSAVADLNGKNDEGPVNVEEIKRQAVEDYKAKKKAEASERMAKARAAKVSK